MNKGIKNNLVEQVKLSCASIGYNVKENEIKEFVALECLLHYCFVYEPHISVNKAYYILLNQHKLGRQHLTERDWFIDNLRIELYHLSSSMNFKKALNRYKRFPEEVRMYNIVEELIVPLQEDDVFKVRVADYRQIYNTTYEYSKTNIKISKNKKHYLFNKQGIEIKVDLGDYKAEFNKLNHPREKKGGEFKITIQELLAYAREVDDKINELIIDGKDLERENFEQRLRHIQLLQKIGTTISSAKILNVSEICNMIGMVGAGKSTLMTILAYAGAKKGYRVGLVVEGIKEVFEMNYLYKLLGVNSCYVTGESTIDEQIEKIIDEENMYLKISCSNLTAPCILDGTLTPNDSFIALEYGKEPCYSLKVKENKSSYLCPFYSICPRKANEIKMGEADIIITHIASLTYGKTYFMPNIGRIPFLYYVIDYLDLVVFDEADKLLVGLDKIFCKEIKVKEYLKNSHQGFSKSIEKIINRNDPVLTEFNNHYLYIINCLQIIRGHINTQKYISEISKLRNGKWFTGRILAEEVFKDIDKIRQDLCAYSENEIRTSLIQRYEAAILSIDEVEDILVEMQEYYKITEEETNKLCFILSLMLLEKKVMKLSATIDKMDENDLEGINVIEIARSPFRRIKTLVPTAPLGNIFGYIYDKEENEIKIFRQFGIGRSMMLDLPRLKIDKEGNALGPNVLFLSGTSFAEGSTRYHIPKEVNYIIKSPQKIINFINKTQIRVIPTQIKVSGSKDKNGALKRLADEIHPYVEDEIGAGHKALFIVNSYDQSKLVAQHFKIQYNMPRIATLVKDNESIKSENWVKRRDVEQFREYKFKGMVAPASVIERGYNIVDEEGHSIFDRLFFLVRPMDVPRDIENIISEINGKVYELTTSFKGENLVEEITKIKSTALNLWDEKMGYYHTVASLSDEEKREIVVSRLVLILQIFGRLLRIRNYEKEPPIIYFVDGAFIGSEKMKFNIINEIENYLKMSMEREDVGKIVELLYGPFYNALKGR